MRLKVTMQNCKVDLILSPSHISSVYKNMEIGKEKGMFGGYHLHAEGNAKVEWQRYCLST